MENDGLPQISLDTELPAIDVSQYPSRPKHPVPGISPSGSMARRYIAAFIDNLVAFSLAGMTTKLFPQTWIALPATVAVGAYLGYYFLTETIFAMTLGKFVSGVKVCSFDGGRCTARQVFIRTIMRIIEVNPFGTAIISALCIVLTRHRQRFGDMLAGTIVVLR